MLTKVIAVVTEPSATRGKAMWGLSYLNIYRARFDACLKYAGLALADGEAVGDRSVMARSLVAQGFILSLTDHLGGRAPLEHGQALAREAADDWCTADATRMLASGYVRQSEHDLSRPIQEEGYALATALGYRSHCAWYLAMRAMGHLEHGRMREARELAEQAVAIVEEIGEPIALGLATSILVECDVLQGVPGAGRARGSSFIDVMRGRGVGSAEGWIQATLAMADLAEGRADGARARLESMLPAFDAAAAYDQVTRVRRPLALALLLLGDVDSARQEAQRLLDHAHRGRNEHVEVIARDLLGRVALASGAVTEAESHVHAALAVAARRDFRLQTLNLLESLARVAVLTGSPTEAARLLAAVHAGREQVGVTRWPPEPEMWANFEERVRAELGHAAFVASWAEGLVISVDEAVGYATRARGKRKRPSCGWESLTPTELDVVRRVAEGLTNPQIAGRMFIARATVKAHLAHIFDKLGISSRSELAAEAARRERGSPGAVGTVGTTP